MKATVTQNTYSSMTPWKMLAWLFATQVLVAFVGRSLAPLGVLIGHDLSLTKAQIGMLPAALFLGQSIAAIPVGYVTDQLGSKRLLLALAVCLGASFMFMTLTSFFILVLIMITVGGLGYGAMHPVSNRGIMYWFTARTRGTAMGIKQMGVTLGSALAALVLLPLANAFGWRPVLLGAGLLLIVVGYLTYLFYYDPPRENEIRKTNRGGFFASMKVMLRHKPLLLVSLAAVGLQGSQMMLNTYLVLFAYEKLAISLVLAGVLLVISEIGGSFGRVGWGVISDRIFNGRRLIILMLISIFAGFISIVISQLPTGTSFGVMAVITFIFGFCIAGFNGVWMNAATELVPREQSGAASGFSIMIGSWGVILGPPLFGLIVDKTGSFSAGWIFLSGILIVVIMLLLVAMTLVKKTNDNPKPSQLNY
ncbi:MFS transporter [Pueribacillus sp. YX66]|uniref:MFS transporter n=1 Tax=Pueribacillus sp. YX66 TaxID=3229242 RepID=UPI00358D823D